MNETLRISVAEDETDMQEYFEKILPRLGHEVVSVAENGSIVADVGPIELLLWFDTLSQLGHDPANLRRARPELEKFRYPVLVADGPRAIDRLLVLAPASRETADAGIIEPFARMRLLLDHTRGSGYL